MFTHNMRPQAEYGYAKTYWKNQERCSKLYEQKRFKFTLWSCLPESLVSLGLIIFVHVPTHSQKVYQVKFS